MQNPPTPCLKGVGFLRACLLAALPSRAFLPPCERDARAPSTRCAGNAGVPPAMPIAREKTYPFKGVGRRARRPYIFPLARLAGEGDKGGEGNTVRLPVLARAGKIISASAIPCQTVVPLSALGGEMLLQACVHGQSSPSARNTARNASATIPYPQTHTATTTASGNRQFLIRTPPFQQAPTLGGECYLSRLWLC